MTYLIIISIVAYILGSFTKLYWDNIPNKYIPIQNVLVGIFSGIICYFLDISDGLVQALVLCIGATMGAGGTADLINIKRSKDGNKYCDN